MGGDTLATLSIRDLSVAAFGAPLSDDGIIAQVIRQVLIARGVLPRRALVGEVVGLTRPIFEAVDAPAVDDEIDALADLGDLVVGRSGDRTPEMVELATGALVVFDGGDGVVLGRLERALPAFAQRAVRARGRVRTLPRALIEPSLLGEIEFHGCAVIDWRAWTRTPEAAPAQFLLTRTLERGGAYGGDGRAFEAFDPMSSAWLYVGRFRPGALGELIERDQWVAARSQDQFGRRAYSLFGPSPKGTRRADLTRDEFLRVMGACAVVARGERPLARRGGDWIGLHFPPPAWLGRLLAGSEPIERSGALIAARLPPDAVTLTARTLAELLFCNVREG